jgi:hypothetical protein
MMDLNDVRWKDLEGGYKTPYDASYSLKRLNETDDLKEAKVIINELYDELHHQGDVGLASYYAVLHLIKIASVKPLFIVDILGLVVTIEIARHFNNPKIPQDIEVDYALAIKRLGELSNVLIDTDWNLETTTVALAALALSKRQINIAKAILTFDDPDTLSEYLENY